MQNEIITIFKLMKLIRKGKAPKKIKHNNKIFTFNENRNDYENEYDKNWSFLYKRLGETVNFVDDFLNDTIEILPEENDEWKDIEEIQRSGDCIINEVDGETQLMNINARDRLVYIPIINKLIKNQKYLKERLDKDE